MILLGAGDAADAKRRVLERAGAVCVGENVEARLAIVALDDDTAAQAAVARLKARGILVNAVDRPALCDFTIPAIVDRDPVLIAIGTGGVSAGLAKALRQRLETMLPSGLGMLATALGAAKASLRERFPDGGTRRRAIDDALREGGPLDPMSATGSVDAWLAAGSPTDIAHIETIMLTTDDPDDLTLRQARLLGQAERVHHDSDVPATILARVRADASRSVGEPPTTPGPGLTLIIRRSGA